MPRNIDDVILPERRRSIRNIPIPTRRKTDKFTTDDVVRPSSSARPTEMRETESATPPKPASMREPLPQKHRASMKKIWFSTLAVVVVVAFLGMSYFSGATLAYTPKSAVLNFNNDVYSAAKSGEGELLYSVVKLSGDKGKSVSASGETQVSRKASGVIVVYNDTPTEQKLIENTRFESTLGKVYRIQSAITIPAKKATPGTLEVTVYADQAGDTYNSAPTDFTVPGLKGTPRYTTIYARSKTAISGGFVGVEKSVSDADTLKARTELRTALSEELMMKAQAEVPVDFILFPSLSSVNFEDLPQTAGADKNSATVNLRGNLYGIMFKKADLATKLASKKVTFNATDPVEFISYDGLKLSFSGTSPADLLSLNKIGFKVEGSALLVWRTDEVALKTDLLGKKKSEAVNILKNYPTISSADVTIRPFWKGSFPTVSEKVAIKKIKVQ